MKPLLTLCMMVKNEAHTIARTLRSAKPWIDAWCILDTGSTDETREIVWSEMADACERGGTLHQLPFVDFATSRNRLLEMGRAEDGEYLLLLDADDVLEGGEALRAALTKELHRVNSECDCGIEPPHGRSCEPDREAFYVRMQQGPTVWTSARVVRAAAVGPNGWRYVGAVHEVLTKEGAPPPSITIPGVTIRHDPPPVSAERSRARWERDLVLLAKDIEADPKNARATFYYAKTLRQLGRAEEACRAFERRIALGGWKEEVYDSAFERAKLLPTIEARVFGMLEAHAIDPRRAEPLAAAAWMLLTHTPQLFAPAYALAKRAWEMPEPAGALFVDSGVYTWWAADLVAWSASHVGQWEIGEMAARQAFEHGPEHQRERLADNLAFYEKRRAGL